MIWSRAEQDRDYSQACRLEASSAWSRGKTGLHPQRAAAAKSGSELSVRRLERGHVIPVWLLSVRPGVFCVRRPIV